MLLVLRTQYFPPENARLAIMIILTRTIPVIPVCNIAVQFHGQAFVFFIWMYVVKTVREIIRIAVPIAVYPHMAIPFIIVHCIRATVDGHLLIIGSQPITAGIKVGEQAPL